MLSRIRRRTLLASLGAALPSRLQAADPWTRPPETWTGKDIQRILTDSPWAKAVSITVGAAMPMGGGGGRRGGRGGAAPGVGIPDASVGGGTDPGMGGRTTMGEGMGGAAAPALTFYIRWQSARPIKLATVKARMGAEADTSPQAREFVEREEPDYVIAVIGPPMGPPPQGAPRPGGPPGPRPEAPESGGERPGGPGEPWMAELKQNTWLAWKDHEKVHPSSVVVSPGGQRGVLVFHFPKDHPIELEDKEVEFCMRRGPLEVKKKFRLRDMVYEGRLCL